jgi:hypothetical protein
VRTTQFAVLGGVPNASAGRWNRDEDPRDYLDLVLGFKECALSRRHASIFGQSCVLSIGRSFGNNLDEDEEDRSDVPPTNLAGPIRPYSRITFAMRAGRETANF